jgi:hypothetical protein
MAPVSYPDSGGAARVLSVTLLVCRLCGRDAAATPSDRRRLEGEVAAGGVGLAEAPRVS